MCSGKRKFASKSIADAEAKRIRKKTKTKMKSYYCEFCTWWHLGHDRHGSQRLFIELSELVEFQKQYGY